MENNKSYRINTKIGNNKDINLSLNVLQNYDILEILSLKIDTESLYRLHTSDYGCVVGRVLANGGVGVPNAKISVFIEMNNYTSEDEILSTLYPYKSVSSKNGENIRYNLLPIEQITECHQPIGTFPNKRLVLDDKHVLEVFETYYKFTTVTNESGDYMLFGVPKGNQVLHMDLDLSDIGFLSQKPIDMLYKGYNMSMFDNSMQFKTDTNLENLAQVISQNSNVYVKPFWGEKDLEEIGITRYDIDVNYKFEPTCIFIGSLVSDEKSSGFSKKCIPMQNMGRMDKLTTGYGTIEMIRKRIDGVVEDFPIMGNELIDGNGTWCYQIPMNLDYVITDEYGNLVPTDNVEKGLPTRTRVRFRVSLSDFDSDSANNHLVKALIPNNPSSKDKIDYVFGTYTRDNDEGSESFRDLLWNNVYTVKSYIPRIQKGNNQRTTKFSGIKAINVNGDNNPMPYNNMRVNITFMFVLQCAIIKALMFFIKTYNWLLDKLPNLIIGINWKKFTLKWWKKCDRVCAKIGDGLCPDLEGWYFAPGCKHNCQLDNTLNEIKEEEDILDEESIDKENSEEEGICISTSTNYFMQCVELNLALENNVIQFDFYNDWINGLIYLPRWFVNIRKKGSFLFGLIKVKRKIQACMEDTAHYVRRYTQQCAMGYSKSDGGFYTTIKTPLGCVNNDKQKCHKSKGRKKVKIFGKNGGIIHNEVTTLKHNVYYTKPCEWIGVKKCNFYATDIVLLGSINKCNLYGIPNDLDGLSASSFQMPPSLVQTNMDSDGVLYGIKNEGGISKCTGTQKKDGVEELEQTFESYEVWNKNQDSYEIDNDNSTEYAVSEISGIDWGISGPNQGTINKSKLYFPGGHFLGISCSNAQVNIKSCVNLSRVCELGAMMSQRQTRVAGYEKNSEGIYELEYKHIIPTGFISKDEISDNNFRNIFATLNHNKLRTMKNENGLREYNFISLQPNNFKGDLTSIIKNNKFYNTFKWDNNNNKEGLYNASAYTRTIEENSRDYCYFRFGLNDGDKHDDKFLLKEGSLFYLPVYENSYYFYFGLKNGSTAIDRFLHDYYAKCPKQGENKVPDVKVEVKNPVICNDKSGSITVRLENIALPYTYDFYRNDVLLKSGEDYVSELLFGNINDGTYKIVINNELQGVTISKEVILSEVFPDNDKYNIYEGSCEIDSTDFIDETLVYFDDTTKKLDILPNDNGGVIFVKTPKKLYDKKPPYFYGFIVVGEQLAICKTYDDGANKSMMKELLEKEIGYPLTFINDDINKIVDDYSNLNGVPDNAIYSYINNDEVNYSFKAWGENNIYTLFVFYTCDKGLSSVGSVITLEDNFNVGSGVTHISLKNNSLGIKEIGNTTPRVLSQKLTYYLNDESLTLSKINKLYNEDIIEVDNNTLENEKKEGYIVYDKLGIMDPFSEWAIKKALYYNTSFYDGGSGSINVGTTGGLAPYVENIRGCGELLNENGTITLKSDLTQSDNTQYSVDVNNFIVPTKVWVDYDIPKKSYYIYDSIDSNGSVPHILTTKR